MPETVILTSSFRASVSGEHREGFCEKCGTLTEKEFYMDGDRRRVRMVCPKCGGQGRLIARSVSIQPAPAPKCLRLRCIAKFFRDCLYSNLLGSYHKRRVTYAERSRHKKIPNKYRIGSPSPQTIWQAIFAIIKLIRR